MSDQATAKNDLRTRIQEVFAEVYTAQAGEASAPELTEATVLLETGLDSLGFAILVTRLEEDLGYDPFSLSSEAYYPQTFGEFVGFYHENAPG